MKRRRVRPYWLRAGSELCSGCEHGVVLEVVLHCSACDRPICAECVLVEATTGEVLCRVCRDSEQGAE